MKLRTKMFVSLGAAMLLGGYLIQPSMASDLSKKQQQKRQIQSQMDHNASQIQNQKQKQAALQSKVNQTQSSIQSLTSQISTNDQQTQQILHHISQLNTEISQNQQLFNKDSVAVQQMLAATYENGDVMYLSVLFDATSFSDLVSRLEALAVVTHTEKQLLNQTQQLQHKLQDERKSQKAAYQSLVVKGKQLYDLKQAKLSVVSGQQQSLTLASRGLNALESREQTLSKQLHMTNAQIHLMEEQTRQQEAMLVTGSGGVVEPSLRYQDISPQKLYAYVQTRHSTFTLSDIEIICNAAKQHDVNPALMVAITGQEEAFVPPGPNAARIRNNPFNVFYSWQVYNTNLSDTANIAAITLRHKLSTPPPSGEAPIIWINDPRNPWGIYATDPHWAYGVQKLYNIIMNYVGK